MEIPRDIVDEIERELVATRDRVVTDAERLAQLVELQSLAISASLQLGRPATVVDLFDAAENDESTSRVAALVRILRR